MLEAILWDHIAWCLDLVHPIWKEHRPNDPRFDNVLAASSAYRGAPVYSRDALVELAKATHAMWEVTDEMRGAELPTYVRYALEYTAKAVARCGGTDATANIMRDVRLFTALAVAQHTMHRHDADGVPPATLARIEADTLEVVQHNQDNDINRRLKEQQQCRAGKKNQMSLPI